MTRLIALLLAVALLALGITGWQWKVAKDDLTSAQRIIGTLSAGIESRDKAIARLDADARASQKREAELRLMHGRA